MSQNIATLADKKELYDLSDLNIKIIENIIEAFNQIHGQRDYETGLIKVNEDLNKTTMRDELERMMANPELGLRQVVPLISMWVDEFMRWKRNDWLKNNSSQIKLSRSQN